MVLPVSPRYFQDVWLWESSVPVPAAAMHASSSSWTPSIVMAAIAVFGAVWVASKACARPDKRSD